MRMFFERVAKEIGFDPLVGDNWYNVTTHAIMEYKVCVLLE